MVSENNVVKFNKPFNDRFEKREKPDHFEGECLKCQHCDGGTFMLGKAAKKINGNEELLTFAICNDCNHVHFFKDTIDE